jgi:hypothetical protein
MSKSYRKPYTSITGSKSSASDKQIASRAVRRTQNRWTQRSIDIEEGSPTPHRLECSHNDVWGWNRDGGKYHIKPQLDRAWNHYRLDQQGLSAHFNYGRGRPPVWPPEWYAKCFRK